MNTQSLSSFHQPAEWERHRACWLAWPSHADLWGEDLAAAQSEFTSLCRAIGESEDLELLVLNEAAEASARAALSDCPVRFHRIPYGDIWLRDTAPLFLTASKTIATVRFGFNGWGGKYVLEHDAQVSARIAESVKAPAFREDWVLEGGSVDVDGQGTCLTTRQCLLNPNRSKGRDRETLEAKLSGALGLKKILWLGNGLVNDHTDGHIDTIARFIAPGEVVCMEPSGEGDPNEKVFRAIQEDLKSFTDARGRRLAVRTIPSPGKVTDAEGRVLPASYLNFYIANDAVIVPTYGTPYDSGAVSKLSRYFPGRRTVGISARAILSGGGAFHCITQQEPWKGESDE